jgi:hypothetical protein
MKINEDENHDSGIQNRINLGRYSFSTMSVRPILWAERVFKENQIKYLQDSNRHIVLYVSEVCIIPVRFDYASVHVYV